MNHDLTEQQLESLRPLAAVIESAIKDTPIRLGTDDWGTMLAAGILVRVAAYMGGVLPPTAEPGSWLTRGTRDLSIPEQAPAADEEQVQRWSRREPLLVLLTRLQRGRTLTADEAASLRDLVETEMREADTARAVAAGNKRHVQVMYAELQRVQADRDTADRIRAEVQRDRDQHAAVLGEVLALFTPGSTMADSGRVLTYSASDVIEADRMDRWRSIVAPTVERPWWVDVAEIRAELKQAQDTIEGLRARMVSVAQTTAAGSSDYDIGRHELAVEIYTVLDGSSAEQS